MFVSETALLIGMGKKLEIMSAEGYVWQPEVDPSTTVDQLKKMALDHFYPSSVATLTTEQYKVLSLGESRALNDHHSVHEERLKDNDILLFVKRRKNHAPTSVAEKDLKSPTMAQIMEATKNLASNDGASTSTSDPSSSGARTGTATATGNNGGRPESIFEASYDFQMELRKIIISLVSLMSVMLQGNPDSESICNEMHKRLKSRISHANNKPIEGSTYEHPPAPTIEATPMGIVHGLREVRKREFKPNMKAVEALRDMGFSDSQIIDALRITKNSKDAACEFILSGKSVAESEEEDNGLDSESPLFKALANNPTVRLGLNNPKMLFAFLNILESPPSANIWLNDSDTAPVLSAIFKIYHAEKNAAAS